MEQYEDEQDYEYYEAEGEDDGGWEPQEDIDEVFQDYQDDEGYYDWDEIVEQSFRENELTVLDRRLHLIHELIMRTMQRSEAELEKSLYPHEVRSKEVRVSAKGDFMK